MQRLAQPWSVHKFLPKFDNPASLSSKNLFSSGHFVPTSLPTNIYKLCILNENEIHNRQPVIRLPTLGVMSFNLLVNQLGVLPEV